MIATKYLLQALIAVVAISGAPSAYASLMDASDADCQDYSQNAAKTRDAARAEVEREITESPDYTEIAQEQTSSGKCQAQLNDTLGEMVKPGSFGAFGDFISQASEKLKGQACDALNKQYQDAIRQGKQEVREVVREGTNGIGGSGSTLDERLGYNFNQALDDAVREQVASRNQQAKIEFDQKFPKISEQITDSAAKEAWNSVRDLFGRLN